MKEYRIGHGYDVHKLVSGRPLILGGVEVPHEQGLLGHSDADVLVHAIMDAIIGAIALGDIGRHFPDSDDKYKGVSSIYLLTLVRKMLDNAKGKIVNIDSTLILQKPKIAPYIEDMRRNIAFALGCEIGSINVKATTEEHLGFTGREEGAAAHAVTVIEIEK